MCVLCVCVCVCVLCALVCRPARTGRARKLRPPPFGPVEPRTWSSTQRFQPLDPASTSIPRSAWAAVTRQGPQSSASRKPEANSQLVVDPTRGGSSSPSTQTRTVACSARSSSEAGTAGLAGSRCVTGPILGSNHRPADHDVGEHDVGDLTVT